MNIADRDTNKEYKEWCIKNSDFLKRYAIELLTENSKEFNNIVNKQVTAKVKECLANISAEEWSKYNGNVLADIDRLINYIVQKKITELFFNSDKLRGYPSSSSQYEWKGMNYKFSDTW